MNRPLLLNRLLVASAGSLAMLLCLTGCDRQEQSLFAIPEFGKLVLTSAANPTSLNTDVAFEDEMFLIATDHEVLAVRGMITPEAATPASFILVGNNGFAPLSKTEVTRIKRAQVLRTSEGLLYVLNRETGSGYAFTHSNLPVDESLFPGEYDVISVASSIVTTVP